MEKKKLLAQGLPQWISRKGYITETHGGPFPSQVYEKYSLKKKKTVPIHISSVSESKLSFTPDIRGQKNCSKRKIKINCSQMSPVICAHSGHFTLNIFISFWYYFNICNALLVRICKFNNCFFMRINI